MQTTERHTMGFTCECGAASCRRQLLGFGLRREVIVQKYGDFIGNHLKQ